MQQKLLQALLKEWLLQKAQRQKRHLWAQMQPDQLDLQATLVSVEGVQQRVLMRVVASQQPSLMRQQTKQ